jgi:hypothetical protein
MHSYKKAGLKSARQKRPPHAYHHQAERTKQNPTPQPRAVQLTKRRQSGKRPVGDRADLVGVQGPAPANHRVSKRSQRSHTPHRHPNPGNRRHTSVPSPLCPSVCLCYLSLHSLLVSCICGCIPHAKRTPTKSQTSTQNSPSATPVHAVFDSRPARTTHNKTNSTKSCYQNPTLFLRPC